MNLEYCQIRAPTSGRIGRRLIDLGNLVTANTTALTTITKFDPMYAYFNVSETNYLDSLERPRKGAPQASGGVVNPKASAATAQGTKPADYPIELGLSNETGYPHQGTINFLDNMVDPNRGTILVRSTFKNSPPYYLASGVRRLRPIAHSNPGTPTKPSEPIKPSPTCWSCGGQHGRARDLTPGELVDDRA